MSYFDTVLFFTALMAWISMTDQNERKIFGWQIFTSVMIIISKDRRMEKLLGRFWYRWSTYPGSIHHQMEDIQPQNFSCATDYIKSLFHLHKSTPTDHTHLDTWNTHTTTIGTCYKEESGFVFAKRRQVSVHGVTSC